MEVSDPSFGGDFNATVFRQGIRNAMTMGLPVDPAERITFRWTTKKKYSSSDSSGLPFSFDDAPVSEVKHEDVQIPAAVEFLSGANEQGTSVGMFQTPRAVITILDEDYELVRGANEVLLGGNTYTIDYEAPPLGLFSVTVYQLHVQAKDES
jgi:hypothetical protein